MAINLHSKYSGRIAEVFQRESLIDGRLNDQYSFSGVRTVRISTPVTVELEDYKRSGTQRYGEPKEMEDVVQELTMSQDKSFAMTIDKGNNSDQGQIKAAGKMLALEIKERVIPTKDRYTFAKLAREAGQIVANPTAIGKANVVERIQLATQALDDAEVPQTGRTLYVPAATYTAMKQAGMDLHTNDIPKEAFRKGVIGEVDGMPVVKVPKGRWPEHVNFLVVYKNSATAPSKISDTKLHKDPPGISGNLLEGRFYYDVFVLGAKADGIYVEVDTGSGKGQVLAAPTIAAATGAISGVSGAAYRYTTDGSDPRYSMSAQAGAAPACKAGDVVKAVAEKDGAYRSPVASVTITG